MAINIYKAIAEKRAKNGLKKQANKLSDAIKKFENNEIGQYQLSSIFLSIVDKR